MRHRTPPHLSTATCDVAQRGHTRRAEAEAEAMAIGNIVDVWRLDTVSPLQKRTADAFGNGYSARLKVRQ